MDMSPLYLGNEPSFIQLIEILEPKNNLHVTSRFHITKKAFLVLYDNVQRENPKVGKGIKLCSSSYQWLD